MKVNLLIIATNKYTQFLPALLRSLKNNFLTSEDVTYSIFTDKPYQVREQNSFHNSRMNIFEIEHLPWPGTTLYRFHFFNKYKDKLKEADYFFYIDADTEIKEEITAEEIIGERVGTQHCGFVNKRGSYEGRPTSCCYVGPNEGTNYFGGGFWGFSKKEFWPFIDKAIEMITTDANNGITPEHHDESVLNRYLIDNQPTKILNPSFHYPMSDKNKKTWKENYTCKILLLDKNHKEIRR